jgi:hypothetical protein
VGVVAAIVVAVIVCAVTSMGPVGALVGGSHRTSGVEIAPAKSIENEPGRDDPDASFCLKEIPVSNRRPRVLARLEGLAIRRQSKRH